MDQLPDTKAVSLLLVSLYKDQIDNIIKLLADGKPASLFVDMLDVFNEFPKLAVHLIEHYSQSISILQSALMSILSNREPSLINNGIVSVRLHSLPTPLHLTTVPSVPHLNKLVQFEGIVVRTGAVRLRDRFKVFQCGSCAHKQRIVVDEQQFGMTPKPTWCPNVTEDGRCKSTRFDPVDQQCMCEDVQEVKVQEMKAAKAGAIPRSIVVVLCADLVERVQAGDVVVVSGRVITRWRPVKQNSTIITDTILIAESIDKQTITDHYHSVNVEKFIPALAASEEDLLARRDYIVRQFCPDIRGMFAVKLAVLLTVIGGGHSDQRRSQGHLLLLGDPGTGKSHVLRAASRLVKRSVMVSGPATTTAGLTVAAVKEPHGWGLEAGALVLADQGLCCIDEFDGISKHDRHALHEALEQQSVSIAKAGMVCRLSTRCSVIAAANGVNLDDNPDQTVTASSVLASPLLSRFDLIFFLLDQRRDPREDELTSEHVLVAASNVVSDFNLPAYIAHCKRLPSPQLSPTAKQLLSEYYQRQRGNDLRDLARTTIRLLESLVRLAEAHCRLCGGGGEVSERDARVAMHLMDLNFTSRSSEHYERLFADSLHG